MASRKLRQQFKYSLRPGELELDGKFVTTTGGAIVSASTNFPGVTSITRTGAGAYTVRFDQSFRRLNAWSGGILHASVDGYKVWLVEDQTSGISGVYGGDGYVKIEIGQSTSATELISGTVFLNFKLSTSVAD